MTTTTTPTAPTFRHFTRSDWDAFAGAEALAGDLEPIAVEGTFTLGAQRDWFVVLYATGGCLVVEGDPQTEYGGYCLDRAFANPVEAEAWFRKEVGAPAHLLDFLTAGFARV